MASVNFDEIYANIANNKKNRTKYSFVPRTAKEAANRSLYEGMHRAYLTRTHGSLEESIRNDPVSEYITRVSGDNPWLTADEAMDYRDRFDRYRRDIEDYYGIGRELGHSYDDAAIAEYNTYLDTIDTALRESQNYANAGWKDVVGAFGRAEDWITASTDNSYLDDIVYNKYTADINQDINYINLARKYIEDNRDLFGNSEDLLDSLQEYGSALNNIKGVIDSRYSVSSSFGDANSYVVFNEAAAKYGKYSDVELLNAWHEADQNNDEDTAGELYSYITRVMTEDSFNTALSKSNIGNKEYAQRMLVAGSPLLGDQLTIRRNDVSRQIANGNYETIDELFNLYASDSTVLNMLRDELYSNPEYIQKELDALNRLKSRSYSDAGEFLRDARRYTPGYYYDWLGGGEIDSPDTLDYEVLKFREDAIPAMQAELYLVLGEGSDKYNQILEQVKNGDAANVGNLINRSFIKDEEKANFLYLEQEYGEDIAEAYYKGIKEGINARVGEFVAGKVHDLDKYIWTAEEKFAFLSGVNDFIQGSRRALGKDIAYSSLEYAGQYARQNVQEESSWLEPFVYDVMYTAGNMAPSILVSAATGQVAGYFGASASAINAISGFAGSVSMGASARGNAYKQARMNGASREAALNYSAAVGLSEVAIGSLLSGVRGIGNNVLKKLGTGKGLSTFMQSIANVDKAWYRIAADYGTDMFSEGLEEYLQETLEPAYANLFLGENNEITLVSEEQAYAALLGMIMAGGFNISSISAEVKTAKSKKAVTDMIGLSDVSYYDPKTAEGRENLTFEVEQIKSLIQQNKIDPGSELAEQVLSIQNKLNNGKTISESEILDFLMSTKEIEYTESDYSGDMSGSRAAYDRARAKAEMGMEYGYSSANISAEALARSQNNDIDIYNDDVGTLLEKYERDGGNGKFDQALNSGKIDDFTEAMDSFKRKHESSGLTTRESMEMRSLLNRIYEATSADSDLPIVHIDDVKEIVKSDGVGNITVNTDAGETTIPVKNFEGGGEIALYRAAGNLDTEGAKELISSYETSKKLNPELSLSEYIEAFTTVYNAGRMGLSKQENITDIENSMSILGDTLSQVAYNVGMYDAQARIETEERVPTVEIEKAGTVTDSENALSEAERGVVQAVAEKLQIPIVVTNEYTINGKTYRLGENNPAKYIVSTATMLLSPDAENLTGSLLHELGEFVTATSPAKSKQICTALIKFYAEEFGSKKASQWIKTYQNAYAAAEGGKTYDSATREVMHDALAAVFSKKRNTQKFIDWLGDTQTKKNANKIKSWFAELLKKMKSVIHSLFTEGKLNPMQKDVASLQEEKLESLADMFLDALDESKAKVQKTTKKEAVEASEVDGDAVNQIVVLPDGTSIVWIEDNIFKGKKNSAEKIVEDYLKNNIGEVYTILESGQSVYLGKDLPGEYTHSKYTQSLKTRPTLLKAKNKATSGLGEMIEIATNRKWERAKHTHNKDAKYGVYKYKTKFAFPVFDSANVMLEARVFNAELVILNSSDGKKYLYDLLKIKRNATASVDLTKMKTRVGGINPPAQRSNASNSSISQPNQNVNTSSSISDEDVGNQIRINGQDLAHIDDNEELKAIVVDMIEQKRRTSKSRRNILSKDVRPFAKQILSDNSSSYNLTTFTSELTKLYELMARGEREDVIRHYANYIGEKILEASDNNGEINDQNRSILNDIKGIPMKLTKAQRDILSDKYGLSLEEYSAKNSRYMTFSANGRYIHDVWSELSSKYPDVFDSSMPKSEMAIELAGIALELSNTYNGDLSLSEDAQYLGAELVAGFDTVGTTMRTGADIEAERISEIKKAKNKRIADIRDFKNEQIKRAKAQYSNAVSENRAIKSDYRAEVREELLYRYEKKARIEQITKSLRRLERMLVSERDSDHVPENLKTTMADFCTRFINKGVFKEKNISLLRRQLKSIADSSESQANVEFDEEALDILEYLEEEMANGDSRYVQELGFRVLDIAEEISLAKRRDVSKLKETLETFKTRYVQDDIIVADKGNLEEDIAYLISVAIDHTENTATIKTLHNLSNELKNADEHSLSAFGLETLDAIKDVVDMFNGIVSNANELFIEGKRQALQEVGDDLISELELKGRKKFKFHPAILRFVDNFVKANTTTNYFFKTIGGVFEKLYNEFLKAQNVQGLRVDQAREFMLDVKKRYNYLDWRNNKYFITGNDGKVEFQVTAGELLMIYTTDKRQQREYLKAIKHLQDGGIVLEDKFIKAVKEVEEEYKKAEKKNERVDENEKNKKIERLAMGSAVKLSDSDISSAVNKLTDEQKKFADEIVEFMSTVCAGWGNETSMKLHNIRKYLETYYFPYVTPDTHKLFRIGSNEQVNRLLGASFTHRTVRKANTPIVLSDFCEIASSHISSMAAYSTHAIPAKNMHDLLNYKDVLDHNVTVMAKLQDAYGTDAIGKYIQEYLNDVQSGAVQESRENLLLKGIGRVGKLQVMAKTSVGLRQFSSLYRAGAELNPKYIAAAHKVLLPGKKKRKKTYQKMKKYSGIVTIKEIGGFDASSGRSAAKWINSNEYGVNHPIQAVLDKGKWDDALGALASASDRLAWCIIWEATEMETRKRIKSGKLDVEKGSKEYYEAVNERFTQVINDTQVYNSVHAKTPAMRAKTYGMKALTQYMGEPMAILNMANYAIYNALTDRSAKNTGKAIRVIFCGIVLGIVADAAINGFGRAPKDDDEDESFVEKWAQSSIDSLWDNLNPISYIPFIKDVYGIFKGFSSEKPEMSLVSDIYWAFDNIEWDKLMDSSDERWDLGEAVTYVAALISGEPIHNVASDIRGLWTTISNETAFYKDTNWDALEDYALDSLNESFPLISNATKWDRSNTGKLNSMYEALLEGNTDEFENIKTRYLNSYEEKTEDDVISEIGERLRSNATLQNMVLFYVDSEWALYEDSCDELLDLGFSEDMIDKAFDHILSKAKTIAKTSETLKTELSEEEKESVQKEYDGAMEDLHEYGLSDEEIEAIACNTNEGLMIAMYEASSEGANDRVHEIVDILSERKQVDILEDKPNWYALYDEEALEGKATESVRNMIRNKYKRLYLDAYEEGNGAEAERILALFEMTGLYEDIKGAAEGWIEKYEEEKTLKDDKMGAVTPPERKGYENRIKIYA